MHAVALTPDRQLSQLAHSVRRTQDGFVGAEPTAIGQTSDGYIWIGKRSGLWRFDGVRLVLWAAPQGNSLPSREVTSLLGGRDGSLWIRTRAGMVRMQNGVLTDYPQAGGFINVIFEDQKGIVWVAQTRSPNGSRTLCETTDAQSHCLGKIDGIQLSGATALTEDSHANLWLGNSSSIERWRPGSFETFFPSGLAHSKDAGGVYALAPLAQGGAWVGMGIPGKGLGLQQLRDSGWKPFLAREFDSTSLDVKSLTLTRDKTPVVGTLDRGIISISSGKVDHFGALDGLSSNAVNASIEDHEGNLWVATSKIVDCFSDRLVVTFSSQQGLTADAADSVLASSDGTIWIGNRHGPDIIRNGEVSSIRTSNDLPGVRVAALFEQHPGLLWVGVDNGLWVYENRKFVSVKRMNGAPTGLIVRIVQDAEKGRRSSWILRTTSQDVRSESVTMESALISVILTSGKTGHWGLSGM